MVEQRIKVVGKRKIPEKRNLESMNDLFKLVNELRKGKPFIPKGVHRFKTFEESQIWTLKMMTRRTKHEYQPQTI